MSSLPRNRPWLQLEAVGCPHKSHATVSQVGTSFLVDCDFSPQKPEPLDQSMGSLSSSCWRLSISLCSWSCHCMSPSYTKFIHSFIQPVSGDSTGTGWEKKVTHNSSISWMSGTHRNDSQKWQICDKLGNVSSVFLSALRQKSYLILILPRKLSRLANHRVGKW